MKYKILVGCLIMWFGTLILMFVIGAIWWLTSFGTPTHERALDFVTFSYFGLMISILVGLFTVLATAAWLAINGDK